MAQRMAWNEAYNLLQAKESWQHPGTAVYRLKLEHDSKRIFYRIDSNIRLTREAAGLTQTQAAIALGTDQRQISWYERGEKTPDEYQIIAMASLYGVTPNDLLP